MKTLAIETAFRPGSIALLESGQVLGEQLLPPDQPTARVLFPCVRNLLAQVGWHPSQIQLLAASRGPGSFTGLRIGLTMAKVFAHTAGCHVLGVNTLQLLAWQVGTVASPLQCLLPAQRQQWYVASFVWDDQGLPRQQGARQVLTTREWLRQPSGGSLVTGPESVLRHLELLELDRRVKPVPADLRAGPLGQLAWQLYLCQGSDDIWLLLPDYGRPSAAEERHPSTDL